MLSWYLLVRFGAFFYRFWITLVGTKMSVEELISCFEFVGQNPTNIILEKCKYKE